MIHDFPLRKLNTFQIEGAISNYYLLESIDDAKAFRKAHNEFVVLGKGSNSIVHHSVLTKAVVQVSADIVPMRYTDNSIHLSAGTTVQQLLRYSTDLGVSGFEFMAGVPATLWGMVAMNFGCWNKEMADMILYVEYINEKGELCRLDKAGCNFSYRSSIFQEKSLIIVSVNCAVTKGNPADIKAAIKSIVSDRSAKQPLRAKTFGSVFMNPDGQYAAQLIESIGLKGFEKNGVKVSSQHANFFENTGSATYESVVDMIEMIQEKVKDAYNVSLVPEVKLIL